MATKNDAEASDVYVIFTSTEWPITIVTSEHKALEMYDRRRNSGNVGRDEQVHMWRARLELIEEMEVVQPTPARLAPKQKP